MASKADRAETRPDRARFCPSRTGAGRGGSRAPPGRGGGCATREKRKAACALTRGNQGGMMAEERSRDLELRRDELTIAARVEREASQHLSPQQPRARTRPRPREAPCHRSPSTGLPGARCSSTPIAVDLSAHPGLLIV